MTASLWLCTAVVTLTIGLWASARLPEYLVALMFMTAAAVLGLAPPAVLFSGFSSAAFWLVLSGFVLGSAILKTGLADRIAHHLAPHLSASWPRMIGGIVLLTYLFAFFMPSNMSRVVMLMPVIMALADRAGLPPGSRGRIGVALATGLGTYQLSSGILPANVPNLLMAGVAESAFGIQLSYMPYLVLHTPVLVWLKGVALTLCVCLMFPARPRRIVNDDAPRTPLSAEERRLCWVLVGTLALWMTDTLHGISPAWVGLGAACVCLLPRVGMLTGDEFAAGVNLRTCLYVAGLLGLAAVVSHSGLGAIIGEQLQRLLPLDPAHPLASFSALAWLSTLLGFTVTVNGIPALYTPLAQSLSDASGLPLMAVLMIQVVGYSTPLLPYQAGPIVVAMMMGKVPPRDGIRLCLLIGAITLLVLVPLNYVWFRIVGVLP